MNIFDSLRDSYVAVTEGLEKTLDNKDYVFVKDKNDNIICTLNNSFKQRDMLDKYLAENNLSRDDVTITVLDTLESKDLEEIFEKHQITY